MYKVLCLNTIFFTFLTKLECHNWWYLKKDLLYNQSTIWDFYQRIENKLDMNLISFKKFIIWTTCSKFNVMLHFYIFSLFYTSKKQLSNNFKGIQTVATKENCSRLELAFVLVLGLGALFFGSIVLELISKCFKKFCQYYYDDILNKNQALIQIKRLKKNNIW